MNRPLTIGSHLGAFVREIGAMRYGPLPRSAMLRNGGAIGAGFLSFLAFGHVEAAVICAFFTNFLCLTDRAPSLPSRLWVQAVGAPLSISFGAVGTLIVAELGRDDALPCPEPLDDRVQGAARVVAWRA